MNFDLGINEQGFGGYTCRKTAFHWKEGLDFLTPDEAFIQMGTWLYDQGKELNLLKRFNALEETFVIMGAGKMPKIYPNLVFGQLRSIYV